MKPSVGLFAPLAFVMVLTFGGFLARWTQPFEIFSHFRLHLATAGVALMFAFAMFGRMRAAACAAVAALANVLAVGNALASPAPATAPEMAYILMSVPCTEPPMARMRTGS